MRWKLFELGLWKKKMKEKIWMKIAWAVPSTLVMWATVRLIAHATQGKYGSTVVPELSAVDALKRWNDTERN